jgi:oligogalacturonide transport system permease protein
MYENKKVGFMFVLPFVIGLLTFKLFPFVMSFVLSFTKYDIINPPEFVGMANYAEIFLRDETFHKSFGVTAFFVFTAVPARLIMALFMANVLNFKLKGINFFRTAYYLPSVLGGSIAVAILWRFLFSQHGLINVFTMKLGFDPIPWLGSEHTAIWTIVLLNVWQFGSAMIIFLAALQNVPASLYEAAAIDGASKMQVFFRITIPLITPMIFFNLINQLVHGFQEFNGPYVITQGGPLKSTYLMSYYIYEQCFRYFAMGYGSALSWILFICIAILSAIAFWSSRHWVYYSDERGN